MTYSIIFMLFILIIFLLMIFLMNYDDYSDEEIITTTTTTTTTHPAGYPPLTRQWENGQPSVIDPVDGLKVYLNTSDDLYEDANGFIWTLN
jgi:hypothetical protein